MITIAVRSVKMKKSNLHNSQITLQAALINRMLMTSKRLQINLWLNLMHPILILKVQKI